MYTLLSHYLV